MGRKCNGDMFRSACGAADEEVRTTCEVARRCRRYSTAMANWRCELKVFARKGARQGSVFVKKKLSLCGVAKMGGGGEVGYKCNLGGYVGPFWEHHVPDDAGDERFSS